MLVHATLKSIRLDYYPSAFEAPQGRIDPVKKTICLYDLEQRSLNFPKHMYNKNYLVRPSVTMMKKQNGNICVIVSWWNIFKVNELKYDQAKNKYDKADTTMHVILYDNKFLASSCLFDTDLLCNANRFLTMQFDFHSSPSDENAKMPFPRLQICNFKTLIDQYNLSPEELVKEFRTYPELDMMYNDMDLNKLAEMPYRLVSPWDERHDRDQVPTEFQKRLNMQYGDVLLVSPQTVWKIQTIKMKDLMLTQYAHKQEASFAKCMSYLNLCMKFQDKYEGLMKER